MVAWNRRPRKGRVPLEQRPDVVKRARSKACCETTGAIYTITLRRPPHRLRKFTGLRYIGQHATSGYVHKSQLCAHTRGRHIRESRRKTTPLYTMVRECGGWDAFDGPEPAYEGPTLLQKTVKRVSVAAATLQHPSSLPRVRLHDGWLDTTERKMITADGGTWRGMNASDPLAQTLNHDGGGQGGEWKRLLATSAKELQAEDEHATRAEKEARRKKNAEAAGSWPSRDPDSLQGIQLQTLLRVSLEG